MKKGNDEMVLQWDEKMVLGIPSIDQQHKDLVEMCNKAFNWANEIESGIDYYDQITQMLEEIKAYTIEHFEHEEELMTKAGCEELTEHAMEHKFFVKRLDKISTKDYDEHQDQKEFILNLSQFLFDWLVHHILEVDKKSVDFMLQQEG